MFELLDRPYVDMLFPIGTVDARYVRIHVTGYEIGRHLLVELYGSVKGAHPLLQLLIIPEHSDSMTMYDIETCDTVLLLTELCCVLQ